MFDDTRVSEGMSHFPMAHLFTYPMGGLNSPGRIMTYIHELHQFYHFMDI